MRRRTVIFIGLFLGLLQSLPCTGQVDSTRLKELDKRLEQYFQILEPQNAGVKIEECDLLIDSAKDSLLRRHIALKVYDHYLESPVMGDEAVAIHLTDKWFDSGVIDMGGDEVLLNAKIFADFNRQSLLGESAPTLAMESVEGDSVTFGGGSDRFRVLLFYDTDCAKCKLELMKLRPLLDSRNWPIDVYAVYTGFNKENWGQWISDRLNVSASRTKVFNLWDPEVTSDYQMKYGVLQTPRMFLIDKDGTIIGRGLDSAALERLLDIVLPGFVDYEYGCAASAALMDKLFASFDEPVSDSLSLKSDIRTRDGWFDRFTNQRKRSLSLPKRPDITRILSMAKALEDRTLSMGDTLSFKHLEGDLLYWLTSRRDEFSKEGTLPFINEYILSRPGIWNTPDDTLKVVGLARMMRDLLSRTPVGSKLQKSELPGWNRMRRKGGYIVFHTEGCPVCKAELAAADSLGLRTFEVNIDEIMAATPDLAKALLDTFDLSSMPLILEIGHHGIIRRRYISFL